MKTKLMLQAIAKFAAGLVIIGALLFLSAGTWYYPGGWLFCILLFIPILIFGLVLFVKAPDLLRKRLASKEKEISQKQVIGLSVLMFVVGFVVAGLDFRFGWSQMPVWIVTIASMGLLLSYGLYAEVLRENAYLSRTVEVQEGQKVIDTGLYGIVRHPMYMASTGLFLSIPLVLGSWFAFIIFLIYPTLLVKRIQNEEALLESGLSGYKAYKEKVKYHMIPFIW